MMAPAQRFQDLPIEERRARSSRAFDRAKAVLKVGDRIKATRCGGLHQTYRFVRWDGQWACSPTVDDIAPRSITHLNGAPISFDDPVL